MKRKSIYENCNEWLINNINYFNPTIERNKVDSDLQIKAFIELVFMCNMFEPKSVYSEEVKHFIKKLLLSVVKQIDFNSYFLFDNFLIAGSEVICEYNNYEYSSQIPFDKERFSKLVSNGLDIIPRRSPYRQLDVRYSLDKSGICSNYSDIESLYKDTILSKNFNMFYLSDDLAYSITHTIFYITDMGRKKPNYINKERIIKILKSLSYFFINKNNLDILSECLICLFFMSNDIHIDDILLDLAFSKISNNIFDDGSIIAPGESNKTLNDYSDEQLFFTNYHTTLVTMGASFIYDK